MSFSLDIRIIRGSQKLPSNEWEKNVTKPWGIGVPGFALKCPSNVVEPIINHPQYYHKWLINILFQMVCLFLGYHKSLLFMISFSMFMCLSPWIPIMRYMNAPHIYSQVSSDRLHPVNGMKNDHFWQSPCHHLCSWMLHVICHLYNINTSSIWGSFINPHQCYINYHKDNSHYAPGRVAPESTGRST